MKLYIYIANINQIRENYDSLFRTKDYDIIKQYLKTLEYQEKEISFQYLTQIESMKVLRDQKFFGGTIQSNVEGFYFGNDTCEHLIPTLNEFQEFEEFVKNLNTGIKSSKKKTISLVTPDVGNYGINRLKILFEYLNSKTYSSEVIVNDLGVLNLLKNYSNLVPILGRMLNKAQRNPIIGNTPEPQVPKNLGIDIYNKIKNFQLKYYNSNPLEVNLFQDTYKKLNIERFGSDYVGLGLNNNFEVKLDLYYPYASVAHGRNCATRGIQEKTGEYYVQDKPCPRYCQKYDIFLGQGTHQRGITQRGNGVWKRYLDLSNISEDLLNNKETRLIYSPFITV